MIAPGIVLGNGFAFLFSIADASFILDSIFFHSLTHSPLLFSDVTPASACPSRSGDIAGRF